MFFMMFTTPAPLRVRRYYNAFTLNAQEVFNKKQIKIKKILGVFLFHGVALSEKMVSGVMRHHWDAMSAVMPIMLV